jgi:predicted HD phosphohydrolase
MPSFAQHCAETTAALGQLFDEVHLWLDEFAGKPPYGMRHRKLRHHRAGIELVRKLWGDQAAEAARLHIIADLRQDGWTEDDPFPRDEHDYKRMGLF